jgi:uncharacterized protein
MAPKQVAIVGYFVLDRGDEHLVANECGECGAQFFDRRNACGRCGHTSFTTARLAREGSLRTYTVVHRGPNVRSPYVSAVVELDGGVSVKANLIGVDPDPDHIEVGMKVRLTTFVSGIDEEGTEAVAFAFEPID